jgi:hypothetical protein
VARLLRVRGAMPHTLAEVEEAEEEEEELEDIEDAGGDSDGDGERGTRALEPHVRRVAAAAPQNDGAAAQLEDARQARLRRQRLCVSASACANPYGGGGACAGGRAWLRAHLDQDLRLRAQPERRRVHGGCVHTAPQDAPAFVAPVTLALTTHSLARTHTNAGQLQAYGYALVDDAASADLWLINTCTVKSPSQSAMDTLLSSGRAANKALLVAGCVPQGDRNASSLAGLSLLGVTQIDRVVEAASETLKGNTVWLLAKKALPALDLPKLRRNAHVEIVPLSTGCLGSCTCARAALLYALPGSVRRGRISCNPAADDTPLSHAAHPQIVRPCMRAASWAATRPRRCAPASPPPSHPASRRSG